MKEQASLGPRPFPARPRNRRPVAVASRSFSRNAVLMEELLDRFESVKFNKAGRELSGDDLVEFLKGAHGAIIALERITEKVLVQLPDLVALAKYGVGLDSLDLEAMERHGVRLGWTGGVNAESVCELTLCFMLGACREVFTGVTNLRSGTWKVTGGTELGGSTVGIIGCGHVGRRMMELLRTFGCRMLVNDILDLSHLIRERGGEPASKEQIFAEADFINLHLPYTPAVRHLVGPQQLQKMRSNAVLINTARGGLVDEAALFEALSSGMLRAAAADVFESEPALGSPLLGLPNFYGTPHIGGSSAEAILSMGRAAISNLDKLLPEPGPE